MTTTSPPPSRPDPSRTGAVWVTGLGAFLLLAAAAVFTAVRWDEIPDAAKLAALVGSTGTCILAGRALRPSLPATAGALFHLGAFMVPVDVAAIGVRVELDWPAMLLAQGLVATATFGWAAVAQRSVVLRWAAGAAVVALAGGIGATTPLPAPLALAAAAAAALATGRLAPAAGWAALAGVAPLLAALDDVTMRGYRVFEQLGLSGPQPRASAAATGLLCAVVLGTIGQRRDDAGLAVLGIGAALLGATVAWTGLDPTMEEHVVALAVLFLVVESAAWWVRSDRFWGSPAGVVATVVELVGALSLPALAVPTLLVGWLGEPEPVMAVATAAGALAWLAADLRREGAAGRRRAAIGMAMSLAATASFATASPITTTVVMLAVAAAGAVLPDRGRPAEPTATPREGRSFAPWPGGHAVGAAFAILGPLVSAGEAEWVGIGAAVAGTFVLTEAAVRCSWSEVAGSIRATRAEVWSWVLVLLAAIPAYEAMALLYEVTDRIWVGLVLAAVAAAGTAVVADRSRTADGAAGRLGLVGRVGAVLLLAPAFELRSVELAAVALAVTTCAVLDAVRTARPEVALGGSVALPVAIGALAHASGLSLPATGLALAVSATVLAGLGAFVPRGWATPPAAAVIACAAGGLALASGDPGLFGDAILLTAGIGLAGAILLGSPSGAYVAAGVMTGGIWLHLSDSGVASSEPYLLPVTALLLVAGAQARRSGLAGSWVAYGPAVGLLGGAALLERVAGGPGWHAVVAGGVAVAAITAGGSRRLAAPLLLGSALLVTLVGFETLAITAGFPTWVWLALGGTVLLGSGVAMERHDLGPVETGRRLVDVVSERFE